MTTTPATKTKHGFLERNEHNQYLHMDGQGYTPMSNEQYPDLTLANLCAAGVDNGYTHLWILPSAGIEATRQWFEAARSEWDLLPTWTLKGADESVAENRLRSVSGWRQKHLKAKGQARNAIQINFCSDLAAWEWARSGLLTAKRAQEIVSSIESRLVVKTELQSKLTTPVTGSPGNTTWGYLRNVEYLHEDWFRMPESEETPFADIPWNAAVHNILWTRTPTDEELARRYVIRVDKGGAFPRAGCDVKQGVGPVVHLGAPAMKHWLPQDTRRLPPGIWHVRVLGGPFEPMYPPIIHEDTSEWHWVTSQMVKAAICAEYELECTDAWVFPESHYVLRQTFQNLWDFRHEFGPYDLLNGAFKRMANDLSGLLRMPELKGTPKFRPDWYAGIASGNAAIMQQNIRKFAELWGLYPILIHVDCIMYLSDKPLEELMPDNRKDMGHFKHEWQSPVDATIRGILSNPQAGSAQKLAALAKWTDEQSRINDYDHWLSEDEEYYGEDE